MRADKGYLLSLTCSIFNFIIFLDSIVILQTGGLIDLFSGETNSTSIINNLKKSLEILSENINRGILILMNLPDLSSAPGLKFAEDGPVIRDNFAVSIAQINTVILKTNF